MDIKLNVEVPPQLVKLIDKWCRQEPAIKQVIIGANIPKDWMHGRMGVFVQETGSLVIDMAQCVKNTQWFQYGVFFLWNAWLNMLWAVFHETAHAEQLEYPEIADRDVHELEELANEWALEDLWDFLEINPHLPDFKQFGWAKDLLQRCINDLYPMHTAVFNEEFSCMGSTACANAIIAAKESRRYKEVNSIVRLIHRINERRDVGVVVNNTPYLTAKEVIYLTSNTTED